MTLWILLFWVTVVSGIIFKRIDTLEQRLEERIKHSYTKGSTHRNNIIKNILERIDKLDEKFPKVIERALEKGE